MDRCAFQRKIEGEGTNTLPLKVYTLKTAYDQALSVSVFRYLRVNRQKGFVEREQAKAYTLPRKALISQCFSGLCLLSG